MIATSSDVSDAGKPWTLVTGASTGIGRELVLLAAADGRNLVMVARTAERLKRLARRVQKEHRIQAAAIPMDLTEPEAANRLFAETNRRGMAVDFLINNAGFGISRSFSQIPLRLQRKMIALNLGALSDLCRLYLPPMLQKGTGRVLNVGSGAGYVSGLGFTVYAATKAFVLSLSEGLAAELAGTGVTVSVLCPGPVSTPFLGTAGIRELSGVRRLALADPVAVARAGYRGALSGKVIINPTLLARLVPWVPRLLPRRAVRFSGQLVAGQLAPRKSR